MSNNKIKMPVKGGVDAVRRKLKEMRRKEPSPELVKTIKEVTHWDPNKQPKTENDGIAAKPTKDLDI